MGEFSNKLNENFMNQEDINEVNKFEIPEIMSDESQSISDKGNAAFENSIEDSIAENDVEEKIINSNTTKRKPVKSHKPKVADSEVVMIKAVSRVATQLNDVWYSFEFTETRKINNDSNIAEERQKLWDTVNAEVDNQVQYTLDSIKGII